MDRPTAPKEWLEDVTIEVTEEDLMVDLDPAILAWRQALAPVA